jgi:UDP-2,3-diacylglucosamine pyrophosphatase LpxH
MKLENIRKIFVLGDLHLGIRNNSTEWSLIQTDYLLNHFIKQVDEEGFDEDRDILVQVGDWNHIRESTNVRIQNLSLEIADKLSKKFKRGVHIILGNHDVYYKDRTDTHSLKGYDLMFNNFFIYEKSKLILINSHKILMLPWIENLQSLKEEVKKYNLANYIFCHADIKNFSLNKSTKLEKGLETEDLHTFTRVYSGHIHIHQSNGNVVYVGTPYEMDRGDRDNPKGFYVLNTEGDKITEKFIKNDYSPKHIKLNIFDILNMPSERIKNLFNNNFIDILVDSSFSERFPITKFTDLVKEFGHRRLEFFSYSVENTKLASEIEMDSNYEFNIFNILEEKITNSNFSPELSDKITNRFKEIYEILRNNKSYE